MGYRHGQAPSKMTKNIKSDYGAAGDGQKVTTAVTLSLGTPTQFTIAANLFVSGDVGKSIALQGATPISGIAPLGALLTKITAVGAFSGGHQTITMADPGTIAISGTSELIEWGTDDSVAFTNFNTAMKGNVVVLLVPPGRYCFAQVGGMGIGFGFGIPNLTLQSLGPATFTDMLGSAAGFFSGSVLQTHYSDNRMEARIQTVAAGAHTLVLKNIGDAAAFSANTWAWMTGYDVQGFGYPPNPQWAEFVYITAVHTGSGPDPSTVTIANALRNSYKSTWPAWVLGTAGTGPAGVPPGVGGSNSLGGPATLYAIHQEWDATHVYNGISFSANGTLFNCNVRSLTINGGSSEAFGPNMAQQQSVVMKGHDIATQTWELDKGAENVTVSNCTLRAINVQSPWPENLTLDTVTITTSFNGTSKNTTIRNCSTASGFTHVGPTSYGAAVSFSATGLVSAGGLGTSYGVFEGDITGAGGWSCSGGLMSRTKAGGTGAMPQWAVPGSYFTLGSRYHPENAVWKCLDISESGGTLFVQTDQSGGFPPLVSSATVHAISAALPNFAVFSGNSGCDQLTSLQPGHPFTSWKWSFTGNFGNFDPNRVANVWGLVVSVKITVTAGYSAGTFAFFGGFILYKPATVEHIDWNPVIDLTAPGVRTITPAGVTGAAGSDSGLALTNGGAIWLVDSQQGPSMAGAVGSGTVSIEIVTDQGY